MPTRLIHNALEEDADRRMAPHPDLWPAIRRRITRRQPLRYLRWALVPTAILLVLAAIVLVLMPRLVGQPTAAPSTQSPGPTPARTEPPAGSEPPRMTLAAFKTLYDNPSTRPLILDVRPFESYTAGHIAGAISFPEASVAARIAELPRNKLIVAYCQ